MNDRKYKIGVIGCGEIAQIMHLPYINESSRMSLWSLCSSSPGPMRFCAGKYNIPDGRCYGDYETMLRDPQLDAVLICCGEHYMPAMEAIKNGKHMLIEKPLAFNTRQAGELADGARKNGLILQVGYMKLYDPGFQWFFRRFNKMEKVCHVNVHNFCGDFEYLGKIYELNKESSTGPRERAERKRFRDEAILEEIGTLEKKYSDAYMDMLLGTTHDTVLLRSMFGPLKVKHGDIADDGQTIAVFEDMHGLRIIMETGYIDARSTWDETVSVWGPDCRMVLEFPSPYLRNAPSLVHINENDGSGANVEATVTASYDEAFRREWSAFLDCLDTGAAPAADGFGAAADIKLASDIVKFAIKMQN